MLYDTSDPEEVRLFQIVTDCSDRAAARSLTLNHPDHLVLLPEYRALVNDFEVASVELKRAITALWEHRKNRSH